MPKMTAIDALTWTQVAMQLISLGATTYGRIRQAAIDAGWAEDDARLRALQMEYDRRIARRQAEAAGG